MKGLPDQLLAVKAALANPIHLPPLSESVREGQRVAIIFSDITRATPYHMMLPPLLQALGHLPDDHITFSGLCKTMHLTHRSRNL